MEREGKEDIKDKTSEIATRYEDCCYEEAKRKDAATIGLHNKSFKKGGAFLGDEFISRERMGLLLPASLCCLTARTRDSRQGSGWTTQSSSGCETVFRGKKVAKSRDTRENQPESKKNKKALQAWMRGWAQIWP
jgi:hypothetical protein